MYFDMLFFHIHFQRLASFDIKSQEKQYDKKMMHVSYVGLILHHLLIFYSVISVVEFRGRCSTGSIF